MNIFIEHDEVAIFINIEEFKVIRDALYIAASGQFVNDRYDAPLINMAETFDSINTEFV